MNKLKKITALLCVCGIMSGLAGCSGEGNSNKGSASGEGTPLVIASEAFTANFNPFFAENSGDVRVTELVVPSLMTMDREGSVVYSAIEGETRSYNGTDYLYTGPADISQTVNDDGTVLYTIKVRDDIRFSDGEYMTADDIIFSYYVLADPSYTGAATLYSAPIVGLTNYIMGSSSAESVTDSAIREWLSSEEGKAAVTDEIIVPVLNEELDWVKSLYGNEAYAAYTEAYPEAGELLAYFYSLDEGYAPALADSEEQVIYDLAAQYGGDYEVFGEYYSADRTYFAGRAEALAINALAESAEGQDDVTSITGIEKISDTEVNITCSSYDAAAIYQICGISVAPMHYYGNEALYDYDNDMFGFEKGDLSSISEKTGKPVGWGPYVFDKYSNKVVYLTANESYYKGVPKIKSLQLKETTNEEMISAVGTGAADISNPSGSVEALAEISSYNSGGGLSGDVFYTNSVDFLGYGYIGINAAAVLTGGDGSSQASKNLRKAFATIFAVYRDVAIYSYYGDAAEVINYPVSLTSWAAPLKTDKDYETAYSVDVYGNSIYTADMTSDEKYAAAKEAALGFLEAAGYTVENGAVTAAPEGAKLEYTVYIGANGTGDHPTFAILTAAKQALREIGITLTINDPADSNEMWNAMHAGTVEMWCAAWQATVDPDIYQVYHGDNVLGKAGSAQSNYYAIDDEDLNALIVKARTSSDQTFRKGVYKEAYDIILDWAVEIPVYQRSDILLISAERVNIDSVAKDMTPYYGVMNEIERLETKGS